MEDTAVELIKIQITHLIRYAETFAGIEVHLPVAGKFIRLNYSEDKFVPILRKLQQKDVTDVYIRPHDYQKVIELAQNSMAAKTFYDPETMPEEAKIEALEVATILAKNLITQIGTDAETLKLLKTVNTRAMTMLAESPTVFAFVKRFKKNCSEEFLRTTLTSYLMSLIIDKFPWKSEQVKEKGALAALLCDIMLEKGDFELIRKWEETGEALPERVERHPLLAAEHLRKGRVLVSFETLVIIEQHHELPNGRGFPLKLTANKFNQLSAIFIIAQQFIEELFRANFDFDKRFEVISKLQVKYDAKNFRKAIDALITITEQDSHSSSP